MLGLTHGKRNAGPWRDFDNRSRNSLTSGSGRVPPIRPMPAFGAKSTAASVNSELPQWVEAV
jgi:hypothetical protein